MVNTCAGWHGLQFGLVVWGNLEHFPQLQHKVQEKIRSLCGVHDTGCISGVGSISVASLYYNQTNVTII